MKSICVFCCKSQCSCPDYNEVDGITFKSINLFSGEILERKGSQGVGILFLLEGELNIQETDGVDKDVFSGEMFTLSPSFDYKLIGVGEVVFVLFQTDHPMNHSMMVVNNLVNLCKGQDYQFCKLTINEPLNRFLKLLMMYVKDGLNCRFLYEEKQEELFLLLGAYYTRRELAVFLYPFVVQKNDGFEKVVQIYCHKANSVQELAEMCGYGAYGFKKEFQRVFGEPVYQWMLRQKADELRVRLSVQDVNLKSVIEEFHFSSPAHFTKFCKKWLGDTPSHIVELAKNNKEQIGDSLV